MNKSELIKKINNDTNYNLEECKKIVNIVENTFIFGKKNKKHIVSKLQEELNISENEGEKLYETMISTITTEIKSKLKHPFRNQDK